MNVAPNGSVNLVFRLQIILLICLRRY